MASDKPKRLTQLAWWRTHKVLFILTILVFAILGFLLYEKIALYENRRNFQQARLAIDSVYADIVRQIGQPDNHKRIDNCTRRYMEFTGYGDITCHVDDSLIYGVQDKDQAQDMYKKIQKIIGLSSNRFKLSGSLSGSITDGFAVNAPYHSASDSYDFSGLKCTANYVYNTPSETSLKINDREKTPFEVTFGCFGSAKALFFPLAY